VVQRQKLVLHACKHLGLKAQHITWGHEQQVNPIIDALRLKNTAYLVNVLAHSQRPVESQYLFLARTAKHVRLLLEHGACLFEPTGLFKPNGIWIRYAGKLGKCAFAAGVTLLHVALQGNESGAKLVSFYLGYIPPNTLSVAEQTTPLRCSYLSSRGIEKKKVVTLMRAGGLVSLTNKPQELKNLLDGLKNEDATRKEYQETRAYLMQEQKKQKEDARAAQDFMMHKESMLLPELWDIVHMYDDYRIPRVLTESAYEFLECRMEADASSVENLSYVGNLLQ
jgi:hypothetical protein